MRFIRHHRRNAGGLSFNATPMVDIIFTLTIFFSLVSRFSEVERIPMRLPSPDDSQAYVANMPDRVLINCRLAHPEDPDDRSVLYSIGPNRAEPLGVISDRLAVLKRESPGVKVIVRADKRLYYADVRAVMSVIARHGITTLNVVAHVTEKG